MRHSSSASASCWRRRPRKSADSSGRLRPEPEDDVRPAFQHDRDRIIHSKAFRRLKHKTQVFFAPAGDHYRTRLTHTLEVSQIARTIAKVLRLHEELTEAIALGHDLGHTPFGHTGERVLDALMPGGFNHYQQSLRIVDVLENDGRGLNLTWEVRDGIARHSKGKQGAPVGVEASKRAATLEGQIIRVADLIAYVNHDIDDAVRAGMLNAADLPAEPVRTLGDTSSSRIARMVKDVVTETQGADLSEIRMSGEVLDATLAMRSFLFEAVYENDMATAEFRKATGILSGLWEKVRERPDGLSRSPHHRIGRTRCGGQGFSRRHDRPVRGDALRTAVHSEALDRAYLVESVIISGLMELDLTRYRKPLSHFERTFEPGEVGDTDEDAYSVVAPVHLVCDIHKDRDKFRLEGTLRPSSS